MDPGWLERLDQFFKCPKVNMGESKYVADAVRAFRRLFPERDGWLVYRTDHLMGDDYLINMLRAKTPGAITRESVWRQGDWHDGPRSFRLVDSSAPYLRKGPGLNDSRWYGELSVVWKGSPIHFHRRRLELPGAGSLHLTLVATKDRDALDDLGQMAIAYWREVHGSGEGIFVIGGSRVPLPKATWDDLILPRKIKEEIQSSIEAFFVARREYEKMGLPYRRGLLFVGCPGGGKSSAAKVIMANTKAKPIALSLDGDTSDSTIETAFREASNYTPSILLIEDLDRLASAEKVSMSFLLNLLDGFNTYEGFLIIATSNHPERIDPALLHRPSRFDRVFNFGLPGLEERRQMLERRSQGKFSRQALEEAAEKSQGWTMAQVQEVVVSAILQAVHARRDPGDDDLRLSVERLSEQYRTTQKVNGAIPSPQQVGFHGNGA